MGSALLVLAAVCFGTMGVFGKFAYEAGVSPGALLLLRFALSAALLSALVVLWPGARLSRGEAVSRSYSGRSRWGSTLMALALGATGYAVPSVLYFSALERIDASLISLVLCTYPVFITLAAVLCGRDHLTPGRAAALVVASCGTLLVILGAVGELSFDTLGLALAFGAAATYTLYVLLADVVVNRLPPVVMSALLMTGASLALAAKALVTGGLDLDFGIDGWFWIGCITVVSTVLAMAAFLVGLRRTGPATAAILSTFEPFTAIALAAITLDEFLTPLQLAGGILVMSSVAVLQLPSRARVGARSAEPAEVEAASGHDRVPGRSVVGLSRSVRTTPLVSPGRSGWRFAELFLTRPFAIGAAYGRGRHVVMDEGERSFPHFS